MKWRRVKLKSWEFEGRKGMRFERRQEVRVKAGAKVEWVRWVLGPLRGGEGR